MAQTVGMHKVYLYEKCSTCRQAMKWLDDASIPYQAIPIRETPPSRDELRAAISHLGGNLRPLFNTSGMDYRALGLKDRLPTLSQSEALDLLRSNGMLIKRPLLIGKDFTLAGFKRDLWSSTLC